MIVVEYRSVHHHYHYTSTFVRPDQIGPGGHWCSHLQSRDPWQSRFSVSPPSRRAGFSLIELLVVLAIISLLAVLVAPAVTGIMSAQGLSAAAHTVSEVFSHARTHAMAHNTYVWVGIAEVDQTANPSARPQPEGIGRVAMVAVASRDGTRIYDTTQDVATDWQSKTAGGAGLVQIGKLTRLENVHLSPTLDPGAAESGMVRPEVPAPFRIGASASESSIGFSHPLESSGSGAQYTFRHVIEFDPNGSARIVPGSTPLLGRQLEIGLRATKGNQLIADEANAAAVHVDGLIGTTTIYRP